MRNRTANVIGVSLVVLAAIFDVCTQTGWPIHHVFATYQWPGAFGWVARETPGNIVAGFLQVGLGFLGGLCAGKLGVFERVKHWLFREVDAHDKWLASVAAEMHLKVTGEHAPPHPTHGQLTGPADE